MNNFIWILFVVNLIQIVTCKNDNVFEVKKKDLQENYNNTQQNQGNIQRNKGTHLNIPKPKNAGNNFNNRTINQQGNVGQGQKPNSAQGTKLNGGNQQNKGPGNQLNVGKGLQLNDGQGNYTNGQKKKNQSSIGQGSNRNSSRSTQVNKTKLNLSNGNQTNNGQLNGGQTNELVGNGKSLQELLQEFSTTRFTEIPVKLSTVTSQPQFYLKQKQATEKSTMSETVSEKKSLDDKAKKNTKN